MKKLGVLAVSVLLAGMLSGCFDSTPSCDDKEVKNLLTDILKEQIFPNLGISKQEIANLKVSYSAFMTENVNKDAKKVACKAKATAKGEAWIYYTAQATDDGSHIYVEILDITD